MLLAVWAASPNDAASASQVWLEVIRALDRIPCDPIELRRLVFTIARRRGLDVRRRARRRPELLLDDLTAGDLAVTPDETSGIDDVLRITALLGQLPPRQAELVALRVIAGFSAADTATLTGRTEGGVRVATMRALHTLRELVALETALETTGRLL